jgi:RNA recognition motif-containing protein
MAAKVLVQHIPFDTTDQDLWALFATRGEIISVDVPRDHITGQLKGYALIEMGTAAEAEDAVQHLNHYELGGRRLRVKLPEAHELADEALLIPAETAEPEVHPQEPPKDRPERRSVRTPRSSVW